MTTAPKKRKQERKERRNKGSQIASSVQSSASTGRTSSPYEQAAQNITIKRERSTPHRHIRSLPIKPDCVNETESQREGQVAKVKVQVEIKAKPETQDEDESEVEETIISASAYKTLHPNTQLAPSNNTRESGKAEFTRDAAGRRTWSTRLSSDSSETESAVEDEMVSTEVQSQGQKRVKTSHTPAVSEHETVASGRCGGSAVEKNNAYHSPETTKPNRVSTSVGPRLSPRKLRWLEENVIEAQKDIISVSTDEEAQDSEEDDQTVAVEESVNSTTSSYRSPTPSLAIPTTTQPDTPTPISTSSLRPKFRTLYKPPTHPGQLTYPELTHFTHNLSLRQLLLHQKWQSYTRAGAVHFKLRQIITSSKKHLTAGMKAYRQRQLDQWRETAERRWRQLVGSREEVKVLEEVLEREVRREEIYWGALGSGQKGRERARRVRTQISNSQRSSKAFKKDRKTQRRLYQGFLEDIFRAGPLYRRGGEGESDRQDGA